MELMVLVWFCELELNQGPGSSFRSRPCRVPPAMGEAQAGPVVTPPVASRVLIFMGG
jgi:hypothetical protein